MLISKEPQKQIIANNNTIGIFDSGVGGLTVFKEIRKQFAASKIIYYGDTARVPYGSKSSTTIKNYSQQNTQFLLDNGVSIIIVACNTSTAYALESLQNMTDIPILGVIKPGAETAVKSTKTGRIGVIGTEGTINSHAYNNAIKMINNDIFVIEKSCPLFVPLAEEGWHDSPVTMQIAEIYLTDMLHNNIDTLVLGCTHYPILKQIIQKVCGDAITLIDSAEAVSKEMLNYLPMSTNTIGENHFYVSDNIERFTHIAKKIINIENFHVSVRKT